MRRRDYSTYSCYQEISRSSRQPPSSPSISPPYNRTEGNTEDEDEEVVVAPAGGHPLRSPNDVHANVPTVCDLEDGDEEVIVAPIGAAQGMFTAQPQPEVAEDDAKDQGKFLLRFL